MRIADLMKALERIAIEHPNAEIVMSDGETAHNLIARPITWSDFPIRRKWERNSLLRRAGGRPGAAPAP